MAGQIALLPLEGKSGIMRREGAMKRQVLTVLMSFAAAMISGAVFVVALFDQFALVEVAASMLTGLQVFS